MKYGYYAEHTVLAGKVVTDPPITDDIVVLGEENEAADYAELWSKSDFPFLRRVAGNIQDILGQEPDPDADERYGPDIDDRYYPASEDL